MKAFALLLLVSCATPQNDPAAAADLGTAIRMTAEKGFTYTIKPVADIPNFESAREELAGASVKGEYSDGVFHAEDGKFEIYRKGDKIAVKTETGWMSYDAFVSPLKQAAAEAFESGDAKEWRKGNVTKARQAMSRLIRLDHLVHRANITRLTNLEKIFPSLQRAGSPPIDGKPSALYEADMSDAGAFTLLQGPFADLVKRGTLSFQMVSGVGQIWIQNGLVRKVHGRVGGKYGFISEEDNTRRAGVCVLDIVAEITKVGETKFETPQEVSQILDK